MAGSPLNARLIPRAERVFRSNAITEAEDQQWDLSSSVFLVMPVVAKPTFFKFHLRLAACLRPAFGMSDCQATWSEGLLNSTTDTVFVESAPNSRRDHAGVSYDMEIMLAGCIRVSRRDFEQSVNAEVSRPTLV